MPPCQRPSTPVAHSRGTVSAVCSMAYCATCNAIKMRCCNKPTNGNPAGLPTLAGCWKRSRKPIRRRMPGCWSKTMNGHRCGCASIWHVKAEKNICNGWKRTALPFANWTKPVPASAYSSPVMSSNCLVLPMAIVRCKMQPPNGRPGCLPPRPVNGSSMPAPLPAARRPICSNCNPS